MVALALLPTPGYNGPISFDYVVEDGNGGEDTGTVTGTVNPTNDPPVADDETFTTDEDGGAIALDLLTGDTDPDGDTLSVKSINGTEITPGIPQTIGVDNGTVSVAADGSVSFTPTPGYNGPISFDYVVEDGNGGEDTGTVTGTVNPTNDPPVADDETFTTDEDGGAIALDLLTGDTDPDGDTLSVKSINGTEITPGIPQTIGVDNGTVSVAVDGSVSFTPTEGYNGPINFDYVVQDGNGGEDTGTVTGTVNPVNDPPVADDESFTMEEDGGSIPLDLLTGDTDPENDTLSIKSINGTDITPGIPQTIGVDNGTVSVAADGSVSFTPTEGYNGPINFDYVVQDGNGGEDTGTVTGTVNPVNDPPVADDESFTMEEDGGSIPLDLLTGDTDPENDTLSIKSINGTDITPGIPQTIGVDNGTVSVAADGSVSFTPTEGYNGPINFDYVVQDGNGGEDTGTVTGTVNPVNDPPVADDESFTMEEDGGSIPLDLLTGDTDPENDTLSIKSINGTDITPGIPQTIGVDNGTVSVAADGSVSFTPTEGYNGPINFDYVVQDGNGGEDTGTVTGTVNPVNDPPVADDESFTMEEDGGSIPLDLLTGDTDPDNDTLSIKSINGTDITPGIPQTIGVDNGTVSVAADGSVSFTPTAGYNGPD